MVVKKKKVKGIVSYELKSKTKTKIRSCVDISTRPFHSDLLGKRF